MYNQQNIYQIQDLYTVISNYIDNFIVIFESDLDFNFATLEVTSIQYNSNRNKDILKKIIRDFKNIVYIGSEGSIAPIIKNKSIFIVGDGQRKSQNQKYIEIDKFSVLVPLILQIADDRKFYSVESINIVQNNELINRCNIESCFNVNIEQSNGTTCKIYS